VKIVRIKFLTLETDEIIYQKLKFISEMECRTIDGEVKHILETAINRYEAKYGKIENE